MAGTPVIAPEFIHFIFPFQYSGCFLDGVPPKEIFAYLQIGSLLLLHVKRRSPNLMILLTFTWQFSIKSSMVPIVLIA